jgi:hypothetical protein
VHAFPSLHAAVLFVNTQPVAGLHVSVVHALLSLQTTAAPAWQTPPPHVSPAVQALPSLHAAVLFVNTQPVAGLQLSVVHGLLSLHTTAVPALQTPPPHVSPAVQALPSLHAAVLFVKTQPVAGLQLSVVHGLLSLHTTAVPGLHRPPPHVSPAVQALPSLHAAVLFVKTHPVAGLQLSVVHALLSLHTTAVPGLQVPPPHVSPDVQALPSLQAFVLLANTQPVAGLQVSVVHGLLSLHTTAAPAWQTPPPHVSAAVQALPSLHAAVLFVNTHPVAGLHVSVVHTFPSLHTIAVPALHRPPPHVSPDVHALPSLQAAVLFVNTHPVAGLHESVVQALLSLQTTAAPGLQAPPPQVSPVVQAFPSVQASALFVNTHPVAGLQVSVVQTLLSLQTTEVPPHTPDVHTSVCVQAVPSLQLVPFGFAGFEQTPEGRLHTPALWHWSDAVQTTGALAPHTPVDGSHTPGRWHASVAGQTTDVAPVQNPLWQVSVSVHALASSQAVPSATSGSEQSALVLTTTDVGDERAEFGPGPICRTGAASPSAVRW